MKKRIMSWKSWAVNQGLTRFEQEVPVVDISEIRGELIIGIIRALLVALAPLLALYLSKRVILSKAFDRILTIIDKETDNKLDNQEKRQIIYNIALFILNLQILTISRFLGRRIFHIQSKSASSNKG